ncbi:hypothetical protein REPUB_Repub13aG0224400 [Reevesia pubescens]
MGSFGCFSINGFHLMILTLVFMCMITNNVEAQIEPPLPPDSEMEALHEIAAELGKTDWNFNENPCNNKSSWFTPSPPPDVEMAINNSTVTCNCSFPNGECYIDGIDLHRNYINGTIPREWAAMELEFMSLSMNRLSGSIQAIWEILPPLRISDLLGESSKFPNLENMTNLNRLDLSFNKLEGKITDSNSLTTTEYIQIDLSYNNFSESSEPASCRENLNLFKSSSGGKNLGLDNCLKNLPCSKDRYSVHINCGGGATTIGDINYEGDEDSGGPAKYFPIKETWETSNTGHFWDTSGTAKAYIAQNVSMLRTNNSRLNTRAHVSPLSLTYYVHCLANGNYTVTLHFAEIVIRQNRSFQSLGRRLFDVHVQEKLALKDFNIANEAKGVDQEVKRRFKTVVRDKTLTIRFHWAGKGTTASPKRGTYGPLISAISVDSDFKPPDPNDWKRKMKFVVAAAVPALSLILVILGILWWKGYFGDKTSREQVLRGLDLQTSFFTFRQMKAATNNFDAANKLGEGGFGSVYKGILLDGTIIAVKQLSSRSKQGNREFVNEIGMISGLQHPNVVRLYGCCAEGNQLLLVYEYMENNSLGHALFGKEEVQLMLDWPRRLSICIGIAKGLTFMHEESPLRIVHRDIKATNVLLDKNINPKISDFGLARLDEVENTHISTRVAGTIGYMAPEYALWGYLTYKADVYSFGVVAMEIVAGKSNMKYRPNENYVCLLDWALVLKQKGNLMELVDPKLGTKFNKEEAMRIIKIALLCTNPSPALRPTMSAVVSMLEGRTVVHEIIKEPSVDGVEMRCKSLSEFDQVILQRSETHSLLQSLDFPCIGSSSTSSHDLSNYQTTISNFGQVKML